MDGDIVQEENGIIYYRASALGGCLTSLVASRMGYTQTTPPEKLQTVYDKGHEYEDKAKTLMRAEGWTIWDEQLEIVLPVSSKLAIRGHIDGKVIPGLVTTETQAFLGEVKSQNEEEYERFNREGWESGFFPKYKWQVSTYMHATGLPLCLVRVKREKDGSLVGFKVEYVDEPFYSISQIRAKVLAAEAFVGQGTIPECDNPAWGCPFWYLPEHGDNVDKGRVELPDAELDSLARDYAIAQKLAKENKEKVDKLRPLLVAALPDPVLEPKVSTMSGIKVTRWSQANPPYVDYPAMVKDGVIGEEVVESYTRKTTGWRMRVTMPKEKG